MKEGLIKVFPLKLNLVGINAGGDKKSLLLQELNSLQKTKPQELYLSNNMLVYPGVYGLEIFETFLNLDFSLLSTLDLSSNGIDDEAVEILAPSFYRLKGLCIFNLGGNKITKKGAITLASNLSYLVSLEHFIISFNPIGSKGASTIVGALTVLERLHSLNLVENGIGNDGFEGVSGVAVHLPSCVNLKNICIGGNKIDDEGGKILGNNLRQGPIRVNLDVSNNKIGKKGVKFLLEIPNIKKLVCNEHFISFKGLEESRVTEPRQSKRKREEEVDQTAHKIPKTEESYIIFSNTGFGNCGVYAVIHATEGRGVDVEECTIDTIRFQIVNIVSNFINLIINRDHISTEEIVKIYQDIFIDRNGGFDYFKFIIAAHLINSLTSEGINEDTKLKIGTFIKVILSLNKWEDLKSEVDLVGFIKNYDFGLNIKSVLSDHGLELDQYKEYEGYASQDDVLLSNSELCAYLLSKGYIQHGTKDYDNGVIVQFINNEGKIIGLFRYHQDVSNSEVGYVLSGTHWEGVKFISQEEMDFLGGVATDFPDA